MTEQKPTVVMPGGITPGEAMPGGAAPERAAAAGGGSADGGARLKVGDVLNHTFQISRYIDAGGMGEVWEGFNVNDPEERVAIKVILPRLAADPMIRELFAKEAGALRRVHHEAIVPYRIMTVEPQLGIHYIVTDFVDGPKLEDRLHAVPHDAGAVSDFACRLARGLAAAHALGVIHRDLSPDNVLLEGGRLDRARIIDFGIVKDVGSAKRTVIDGRFAGKLGFGAPEQLGDFDRQVGPWTDVYSLGLVTLAVAAGRAPEMGATPVEAIDRRRAGVDLSAAPEPLRPVLAAMLRPDPAQRLRSMAEVIAAFERPVLPPVDLPEETSGLDRKAATALAGRAPLIAGGCAALLLAGGLGWWLLGGDAPAPAPPPAITEPPPPAPVAVDPVAAATAAARAALPRIACSWLDLGPVRAVGSGVALELSGVAGDPAAAQGALGSAVAAAAPVRRLDARILTLPPGLCPAVETFAQIRAPGPPMLSITKQEWKMQEWPDAFNYVPGKKVARVPLTIDPRISADDFTLVAWDGSGPSPTGADRRQLLESGAFKPMPDGRYTRGQNDTDVAGVSGALLLRGRGPFDAALVAPEVADAAWRARFLAAAAERGWKADMVWFRAHADGPG